MNSPWPAISKGGAFSGELDVEPAKPARPPLKRRYDSISDLEERHVGNKIAPLNNSEPSSASGSDPNRSRDLYSSYASAPSAASFSSDSIGKKKKSFREELAQLSGEYEDADDAPERKK